MGCLLNFCLILHVLVWQSCGAPVTSRAPVKNTLKSADVISLKDILSQNEDIQVFDNKTILLYKPDAVYQVNVPQQVEQNSAVITKLESPMVLVKKLELSAKERITLETFRQLTDINQNADLVFMDWDLNGDGVLDLEELLLEEIKLSSIRLTF
ncbi:hypothetical protein EB796_020620 [Bugula neritina]|uniref:EF-hand domain-containing protein n=1 Tax=Bugula neritina TaxID=10212 RepID=A0A7J7J6B8_BUGNE|nr:hypothetical protein EB796_020620 [Bugula neritina]